MGKNGGLFENEKRKIESSKKLVIEDLLVNVGWLERDGVSCRYALESMYNAEYL